MPSHGFPKIAHASLSQDFVRISVFDLNTLEIPDVSLGPTLESILHPEDGTEPV